MAVAVLNRLKPDLGVISSSKWEPLKGMDQLTCKPHLFSAVDGMANEDEHVGWHGGSRGVGTCAYICRRVINAIIRRMKRWALWIAILRTRLNFWEDWPLGSPAKEVLS